MFSHAGEWLDTQKEDKKRQSATSNRQILGLPTIPLLISMQCTRSLLFRLMTADMAAMWNSQLRTSRKAVTDIIIALHSIGSKRPNNKVTSFPRNNRNSPCSSHPCIHALKYKVYGNSIKRIWRFSELSSGQRCLVMTLQMWVFLTVTAPWKYYSAHYRNYIISNCSSDSVIHD